jgi:uncharacterized SAM-binding protein YcdF (DUF218 family)
MESNIMDKITIREKFIAIVDSDMCKKSDAIILLEGDGTFRNEKAVELYLQKWAPTVVFSGGFDDPKSGAFIQHDIIERLVELGVNEEDIILERKSLNTRQQGEEVMKLVIQNNWKRIILVGTHYHQYRAFLTFLKCMKDANILIEIINVPARCKWFSHNEWGRRTDIMDLEFEKIEKYKSHCCTLEEGIEHQEWKETQGGYDGFIHM